MQTFIFGHVNVSSKKVAKVDQRCDILSPKLERIWIFGCNPNVIGLTTIWDNGWKTLVELHGGCDYHCN